MSEGGNVERSVVLVDINDKYFT